MAGIQVFHDFSKPGNAIGVVGVHWVCTLNSWNQMNLSKPTKKTSQGGLFTFTLRLRRGEVILPWRN